VPAHLRNGGHIISLFRAAYPQIRFLPHEEIKTERYYATYSLGLFFDDKQLVYQPCDFRHVGLHRTAGYILGVDPTEIAPRIVLDDETRPIPDPYVCIAVQSTTQSKYWNNPVGWLEIVAFLKQSGYRVICIDQQTTHGQGLIWNHIPNGAEDETGERSLQERALAKTRRFFHRSLQWTFMAQLGSRHSCCDDLGIHSPDERVPHALSDNQLSRLQQLLE
jgi:autotransporter strand-loop-strand O-heptosyltransferase